MVIGVREEKLETNICLWKVNTKQWEVNLVNDERISNQTLKWWNETIDEGNEYPNTGNKLIEMASSTPL